MTKQFVDSDPRAIVRQFGNVCAHVVGERQLAVFSEHQDGGGGELLRNRSSLKHGGWVNCHVVLQIGGAVTTHKRLRPFLLDAHYASRLIGVVTLLEDCVHGAPDIENIG